MADCEVVYCKGLETLKFQLARPPSGERGSLRRGHLCFFWVHSTLEGHGALWKVLQSRLFGSGDKNIA